MISIYLAYKTQVDYTNCLESMLDTQLNKNFICTTKVLVVGAIAKQSYEKWLKRSIYGKPYSCNI